MVIGSGPNGLAAAIALARAGRAVTVLEAADTPGGAVRTQELTLPGFRHDTFSSVYPATAASPVFAGMPLARFGLEWVHPQACSAHPLADGRALALYRDLDRTADELNAARPGDGDAWRAFVEPLLDVVRRGPRHDAGRLPTAGRTREAAARAPVRSGWRSSRRCCPAPRAASDGGCSRTPTRARGSTAPPVTETCRPPGRGRRSPSPT